MSDKKCIDDNDHVWCGVGHNWECRVCGKAGVDCNACEGSGWRPAPPGDICREDCEACQGAGVVPAKEVEP